LLLAAAANGRYFGGGMLVAPQAHCDDGKLDVVVVAGLSKAQLLTKLVRIYRGTHLADPAVESFRGRVIEAQGASEVRLEVDGEPVGCLPVRIEVLEGALSLLAPAP
jgi:diacylglycerol kinase (ATP)